MCMYTLQKVYDPPKMKEVRGYKLMEKNVRTGNLQTFYEQKHLTSGEWISDTRQDLLQATFEDKNVKSLEYPTGFHFFTNKRQALAYFRKHGKIAASGTKAALLEIRARKIVAKGLEGSRVTSRTSVAQEILLVKIIKEVK